MYYKFLLFDLDHTLLDFDLAEDFALNRLLRQQGVTEQDLPTYKAVYLQLNQAMWRQLERGEISKSILLNTRFAKLFDHFGRTADGTALAAAYVTCLGQEGQTYPGAKALLLTLKERGYRLFAATNGVAEIQSQRLEMAELTGLFEQVFISEDLSYAKPDSRFFSAMTSQIANFDPNQALMIGDNLLADIQGASEFGLATAWYNPSGKAFDCKVPATYEVRTYEELLKIL